MYMRKKRKWINFFNSLCSAVAEESFREKTFLKLEGVSFVTYQSLTANSEAVTDS